MVKNAFACLIPRLIPPYYLCSILYQSMLILNRYFNPISPGVVESIPPPNHVLFSVLFANFKYGKQHSEVKHGLRCNTLVALVTVFIRVSDDIRLNFRKISIKCDG